MVQKNCDLYALALIKSFLCYGWGTCIQEMNGRGINLRTKDIGYKLSEFVSQLQLEIEPRLIDPCSEPALSLTLHL